MLAVLLGAGACTAASPETRDGLVGGRVLMAPGAGLAGATVTIEQLHLDDGKAAVRKLVGVVVTDAHGTFEPVATGTVNGLLLLRTSGGSFRDPISGALVRLDATAELRALHWLGVFEDRSESAIITPVHALVEARFRHKLAVLGDPTKAVAAAYEPLGSHLGAVNWETVVPADLSVPAASPTDEVRAAFVLGGLAVLADDLRLASDATPQVVNLMTVVEALRQDLGDALLDGNDGDDRSFGSGLQLGPCAPLPGPCAAPPGGCVGGACRTMCDAYSNSLRTILAGEVTKFLGTREAPSVWNRTSLGSQDARTLIEGIGRNPDPELFGDACLETVDRLPPSIGWSTPAADQLFLRGEVSVSFAASDDSGVPPIASFAAAQDEDGDLTNNVARTTLHTTTLADGPMSLTAVAVDRAGNERRVVRSFEIDNTAPALTVESGGYLVDARAWWTTATAPTLRGAVTEPHLRQLTVTASGDTTTAAVSASTWSVQLPVGAVARAGTAVMVRAEDLAGNVTTRSVTLRLDDTAPAFAAVPTAVRDERSDLIGFSGVEPTHRHLGPAVTLGTEGCPDVYKHAYLLDEAAPLYGGELDGRNPLRWRLRLTDDGVGIEPVGAQVRVKVAGAGGATLLDWTEVTGTDLGGGVQEYDLTLYRAGGAAPLTLGALGTFEGALELELRGRDRFGREVTGARCWTHHPLAAPLHVGEAYTPGVGGHPAHALALMAHGLDSGRTQDLSTLLLNPGATGASVMDSLISNGTAEAVYLRVTLAAPPTAAITRAFSIGHEPVSVEDTDDSCAVDPGACLSVPATITQAESFPAAPVPFELRLFSASATGVPGAEVQPCQEPGCMNTPTVRTYRIAPRVDATIPRYVATAWLKQATALRPANAAYPAEPPFAEFVQAARLYTGKQTDADFCSRTADRGIPRVTYCTQRTYYKRRQSLDSATIGLEALRYNFVAASTNTSLLHPPPSATTSIPSSTYSTIEQ